MSFIRHAAITATVIAPCFISTPSRATEVAVDNPQQRIDRLEAQLRRQQRTLDSLQNAVKSSSVKPSFNPDLSLILQGAWTRYGSDTPPDHQQALNVDTEAATPGLALGESEIVLSANIDQNFRGQLIAAFENEDGETSTGIEEAWAQAAVTQGLTARVGRFLSGFGYLNEQHGHAWDISSTPLAYRYVLGGPVGDDGVQLNYILPLDTYVAIGAEALRGDHYPATPDSEAGTWTGWLTVGGDLGDRANWLMGVSHLRSHATEREIGSDVLDEAGTAAAFTGDSRVNGVEAVFKYAPTGNSRESQFKLQAEYLSGTEDGELALSDAAQQSIASSGLDSRKHGYYVLASYRWNPAWKASMRFDRLHAELDGDALTLADAGLEQDWSPFSRALSIDWEGSEFSRIRLEYAQEKTPVDTTDILSLGYTFSLGAHGAHRY